MVLAVRLGDHLAPGITSLLEGREHLPAGVIGGLGRRFELVTAVAPLHGHPERPQPGVDEPGRAADLGQYPVPHLIRRAAAVGVLAHGAVLHPPQAQESVGSDLRLGVLGVDASPVGHGLRGHLDQAVHHVAVRGAQRRGALQQVHEAVHEAHVRRLAGILVPVLKQAGHLVGDQPDDGVDGRHRGAVGSQRPADVGGHALLAVEDERLLGREVVVDRLLRHIAGGGDLGDPEFLEAPL